MLYVQYSVNSGLWGKACGTADGVNWSAGTSTSTDRLSPPLWVPGVDPRQEPRIHLGVRACAGHFPSPVVACC